MSRESARKLRRHPWAREFRDAWDAASDCRYAELEEAALERSTRGVARPIFYKGEQVGEWRHYDERLTMFLLRFRRRQRFGPETDTLSRPASAAPSLDPDEELPFDPESLMQGCIEVLDYEPEPLPEDAAAPEAEPGSDEE